VARIVSNSGSSEVVDLVEHLGGARVAPVDLVDDHDRRQARLERLLEDEARLRQRPLGGVDQEQDAVDERQGALDLRAEIGVAGGVHDVDVDAPVVDGRVLGHDRDAFFALEVDRVHDALGHRLVLAKEARLPEHRVDEGGLAVVDVSDDRDVPDVFALPHRSIVSRRNDHPGRMYNDALIMIFLCASTGGAPVPRRSAARAAIGGAPS